MLASWIGLITIRLGYVVESQYEQIRPQKN